MILHFLKRTQNLVQAALGPVALDLARSQSVYNEEQHLLAKNVLVISVLAIVMTAPLGKWQRERKKWEQTSEGDTEKAWNFKLRLLFLLLLPQALYLW